MRKLTFAKEAMPEYAEFVRKFGRDALCPEGVPFVLCVEEYIQPRFRQCKEYGAFLGMCIKRNKPPTAREYIDCFYLGTDGVYRGGFWDGETRNYKEFVEANEREGKGVLF